MPNKPKEMYTGPKRTLGFKKPCSGDRDVEIKIRYKKI